MSVFCVLRIVQHMIKLLQVASATVDEELEELGADDLLLTGPVVDNPRNIMDTLLQQNAYQVSSAVLNHHDQTVWVELLGTHQTPG